jgi:Zinc carboxypeptidase
MFIRLVIGFLVLAVPTSLWAVSPHSTELPTSINNQYSVAEQSSSDFELEGTASQNSSVEDVVTSDQTQSFDTPQIGETLNSASPISNEKISEKSKNTTSPSPRRRRTGDIRRKIPGQPPTSVASAEQPKPTKELEKPEDEHNLPVKISYIPPMVLPASEKPTKALRQAVSNDPDIFGFTAASLVPGSIVSTSTKSFTVTFGSVPSPEVIEAIGLTPPAPITKSVNGNVLTVNVENLRKNTPYKLGVRLNTPCQPDLKISCNPNQTWSYYINFSTDAKETIIFGKSVQGRDLVAQSFGGCSEESTCKRIMLTGGIHGSEWRSGDLSNLQSYLDQNPQELLGKNKEITIIPYLNPDGTTLNIRENSNGVNLNRNFPTGFLPCNSCGASSLSEPETQALYNFVLQKKPTHLISYHAQWPPDGILFKGSDTNAETDGFARWVSERTGYPIGYFTEPGSIVSGDQTVWGESVGVRSVIIESASVNSSDWTKNFNMYLGLMRDL